MFTNILTGHCISSCRTLLVCASVLLTVFEMQGFKLKNENNNDKKNWRNIHNIMGRHTY